MITDESIYSITPKITTTWDGIDERGAQAARAVILAPSGRPRRANDISCR